MRIIMEGGNVRGIGDRKKKAVEKWEIGRKSIVRSNHQMEWFRIHCPNNQR
jgi:hypothetical protein